MFDRTTIARSLIAALGLVGLTATGASADTIDFQAGISPDASYESPGGMISSSSPTINYGTWQQAYLGYDYRTTQREWRVVYSFDVSALPDDADLTAASFTFNIYAHTASTADTMELELRPLIGDFTETQATWTNRDSTTAWTTPGGDFGAPLTTVTIDDPDSLNGNSAAITFNSTAELVAAVQEARDTNTPLNLILKAVIPNGATDRALLFTSSNDVEDDAPQAMADRPVLHVEYVPEPGSLAALGIAGAALLLGRRR